MKKISTLSLFVALAAILAYGFAAAALGDNAPGDQKLKFSEIKTPKEVYGLSGIESMLALGDGTAIGFATGKETAQDPFSLFSLKLSRSGKLTAWHEVAEDSAEWYLCAVWVNTSKNNPAPSAKAGKGFLFYTFTYGHFITIRAAEFDSNGQIVGQPQKVFEQELSSDTNFDDAYMAAGIGPSSIALAFSTELSSESIAEEDYAEAYLIELGFDGNLIGQVRQVPLVNGGKGHICWVGKPAWNGANWLIPAKLYDIAKDRDHVYVFAAPNSTSPPNAPGSDIKVKRVLKGKKSFLIDYMGTCFQFLPAATGNIPNGHRAPSSAENLKLLIQQYKYLPKKKQKALNREFFYTILEIKSNGKKTGGGVAATYGTWSPTLKYTEYLEDNRESLSYCMRTADGRLLMAVARGASGWEDSDTPPSSELWDYKNQINILTLDPESGVTEVLASQSHDIQAIVSGSAPPIVQAYKKAVKLVTVYYGYTPGGYFNYFTSFTP